MTWWLTSATITAVVAALMLAILGSSANLTLIFLLYLYNSIIFVYNYSLKREWPVVIISMVYTVINLIGLYNQVML